MPIHRRLILTLAGGVAALLVGAGSAQARIVEIGSAEGTPAPTCPTSPCLAISRTTGYQTMVGDKKGPYRAPAGGRIVAWTIALGNPNEQQVAFFDDAFGPAKAGLTVLRRGKKKLQRFNVARSGFQRLAPYFGQVVQFPLHRTFHVRKGDIIALTVPTWAPALSPLLSDGSAWLASRPRGGCDDTDTQTAHTEPGPTRYRCKYAARLTYSATLVTAPQPNDSGKKRTTKKKRSG
jgi:hypothetical protein